MHVLKFNSRACAYSVCIHFVTFLTAAVSITVAIKIIEPSKNLQSIATHRYRYIKLHKAHTNEGNSGKIRK